MKNQTQTISLTAISASVTAIAIIVAVLGATFLVAQRADVYMNLKKQEIVAKKIEVCGTIAQRMFEDGTKKTKSVEINESFYHKCLDDTNAN